MMTAKRIATLVAAVLEGVERDRIAGRVIVPRPAGLFVFRDSVSHEAGNYEDDFPMMSQDDWCGHLNPNEGCK